MDGSIFTPAQAHGAQPALIAPLVTLPGEDGLDMLARHYAVQRTLLEKLDRDPERKKCRSLTDTAAAHDLHTRMTFIGDQLACDPADVLHLFIMRPGLSRRDPQSTITSVTDTTALLARYGVSTAAAQNALLRGNAAIVMQMSPTKLESRVSDLATWHGEGLFHHSLTRQDAVLGSLRRAVVGDGLWQVYHRIAQLRPLAARDGQKPTALFSERSRQAADTLARYEGIVAMQQAIGPRPAATPRKTNATAFEIGVAA